MKKIIICIILVFLSSNVFALSFNDFNTTIDFGIGYSNCNVYLYGTSLNLKGHSIIIPFESNLKEHPNTSLMLEYNISNVNLTSSDFPVNDDMLGQDLNDIFSTQNMIETFFGIRNYIPINSDVKLYADYGLHKNYINLECNELLWLMLNTGFYAGVGVKTKLNNKIIINIGYKSSIEFLCLPITDLYYTDALKQRINEKDPFWGTNSFCYISLDINSE